MTSNRKLALALLASTVAAAAAVAVARVGRNHPSRYERQRIGYPPLDTPKAIGDGIWIIDSGPISVMGLALPVRMTVMRLGNGDLLLHSPVALTAALRNEVAALGRVSHLIAPSIAHWTFLPAWQRAFPEAKSWSVPGLRDRRQVRQAELRIDRELGVSAPEEWSSDLDQSLIIGGAGFAEAYFFHRPSRTLLLTDLVENLEPEKLPSATAAVMGAAGATDGKTPYHVRLALLAGGSGARTAIETMLALEPERVVFAHGRWFEERGSERLKHAFDWLT